jgi:hypothetical protein
MLVSLLIVAVAVLLLAYWFRYTCLLLIRAEPEAEKVVSVAEANALNLPSIQAKLRGAGTLDGLDAALEDDYRILSFLLNHAAGLGVSRGEQIILAIDFRLMQVWYWITRKLWPAMAHHPLREMTAILARMAGAIGERARVQA